MPPFRTRPDIGVKSSPVPITTRLVEETGIFETVYRGIVTDDDYLTNYRPFFEAGLVPMNPLELHIIESNTTIELTSSGFKTLIQHVQPYYKGEGASHGAIVSLGSDVSPLINHFTTVAGLLGESQHDFRTFDSFSTAMIWLLGFT